MGSAAADAASRHRCLSLIMQDAGADARDQHCLLRSSPLFIAFRWPQRSPVEREEMLQVHALVLHRSQRRGRAGATSFSFFQPISSTQFSISTDRLAASGERRTLGAWGLPVEMSRFAALKILLIMLAMALAPSAAAFAGSAGSEPELAPPPDTTDPHFRFTFAPILVPMVRAAAGDQETVFARLMGEPSMAAMVVVSALGIVLAMLLLVRIDWQERGGPSAGDGGGVAGASSRFFASYLHDASKPSRSAFSSRERQQVMLRRAAGER